MLLMRVKKLGVIAPHAPRRSEAHFGGTSREPNTSADSSIGAPRARSLQKSKRLLKHAAGARVKGRLTSPTKTLSLICDEQFMTPAIPPPAYANGPESGRRERAASCAIVAALYGKEAKSSGQVKLNKDLDSSIEGKTVIVVEDILDTGLTLEYLLRVLQQRKPKHLKVAVLLDKKERRLVDAHTSLPLGDAATLDQTLPPIDPAGTEYQVCSTWPVCWSNSTTPPRISGMSQPEDRPT